MGYGASRDPMNGAYATRFGQQGASLLQSVTVIVLIGVLLTVFIEHVLKWGLTVEQAAIARMTSDIRHALSKEVAVRAALGKIKTLDELDGANPMQLQARFQQPTPPAYAGEIENINEAELSPGFWYYETAKKIFLYRVRHATRFQNDNDTPLIRYQIQLKYQDKNKNKKFDRESETISQLSLVSLDKYTWK